MPFPMPLITPVDISLSGIQLRQNYDLPPDTKTYFMMATIFCLLGCLSWRLPGGKKKRSSHLEGSLKTERKSASTRVLSAKKYKEIIMLGGNITINLSFKSAFATLHRILWATMTSGSNVLC